MKQEYKAVNFNKLNEFPISLMKCKLNRSGYDEDEKK
jgi:hypothetical protein